jgi:hypothetical protein
VNPVVNEFAEHIKRCPECKGTFRTAALCSVGRAISARIVDGVMGRTRDKLGTDARLGAVEGDGQETAVGYGHGV